MGKSHRILWDLPRYFPATLGRIKGYKDIAACVTYLANADGSLCGAKG